MAKMYYDNDADLTLIRGKKVAVIGYGSQGHAHALNLRDSGVRVVVALSETSNSRARAEAEGLCVVSPAEGAVWGDVIVFLAPDTTQPAIYRDAVAPNLTVGKALFFAHGFNIHFATIQPPADIDVIMIAPKAPGHRVREVFIDGGGTPDAVTRFFGNTTTAQAAWFGGELVDTNNVASQTVYDQTRPGTNMPNGSFITPGGLNYPVPGGPTLTPSGRCACG